MYQYLCILSAWLGFMPAIWAIQPQAGQQEVERINLQVFAEGECKLDTLRLYGWRSVQVEEISKAAFDSKRQAFVFELQKVPQGMYYLGADLQNLKLCYLGTEKKVSFTANCGAVQNAVVKESSVNRDLERTLQMLQTVNAEFMALIQRVPQAQASEQSALKKAFGEVDAKKRNFLDSLRKAKSPVYRIVALNGYQSFQNNGQPGQTEGDYIAQRYFDFVDFKDSVYGYTPFFFESVKNYSGTLTKVGLSLDAQRKYIDALWDKISAAHPNHIPLALGLTLGLMQNNNDLFLVYAERFLSVHSGKNQLLDAFLNEQIKRLIGPLPLGRPSPNLEGDNPQGKKLSLRDLRGKVVLIDFWASWCGPCRKDNPHVVGLYNKYKDKGLEIFGVSLDTDRNRWIDAIAKDGLTWPQISDLRGWQSSHGQLYGVSSIPFTVLLDREGNVLAKQLRGAALDAKLKEIFGF